MFALAEQARERFVVVGHETWVRNGRTGWRTLRQLGLLGEHLVVFMSAGKWEGSGSWTRFETRDEAMRAALKWNEVGF